MKLIFCAGNTKEYAEISIKHGWLYGIRHDNRAYYQPHFIDINWKSYDWGEYLDVIRKYKPQMAMVPDYEKPNKEKLFRMIEEVRDTGVHDVLCCPKFHGAIDDIPLDCIVAISVPSSYAGFLPEPREINNRVVHLLGGTPQDQIDMYRLYTSHGAKVLSLDCNAHMKASMTGTFFDTGRWKNYGTVPRIEAFNLSAINIKKTWEKVIRNEQLRLI